MSTLHSHAWLEFKALGWTDEDGKFKDEWQELICTQVLELLTLFSEHGHSGSSAPYAINLFKKLASFEPVGPLTGEDWEWGEVDFGPEMKFQNKRCGHVFKNANGEAYDSEGIIFWEWLTDKDTGEKFKVHFTCKDSRVPVTFPYVPERKYVERVE